MNTDDILEAIDQEISRLTQAKELLAAGNGSQSSHGFSAKVRGQKRKVSAA